MGASFPQNSFFSPQKLFFSFRVIDSALKCRILPQNIDFCCKSAICFSKWNFFSLNNFCFATSCCFLFKVAVFPQSAFFPESDSPCTDVVCNSGVCHKLSVPLPKQWIFQKKWRFFPPKWYFLSPKPGFFILKCAFFSEKCVFYPPKWWILFQSGGLCSKVLVLPQKGCSPQMATFPQMICQKQHIFCPQNVCFLKNACFTLKMVTFFLEMVNFLFKKFFL